MGVPEPKLRELFSKAAECQSDEEQAFEQLDCDDCVKRRSALFDSFGFGAHGCRKSLKR